MIPHLKYILFFFQSCNIYKSVLKACHSCTHFILVNLDIKIDEVISISLSIEIDFNPISIEIELYLEIKILDLDQYLVKVHLI